MELSGATVVEVPETLTAATVRELASALDLAFSADSAAVVLQNDGPIFCQGLDLELTGTEDALREAIETFASCLTKIRTGPKPVLAVVRGSASGGGVGLAAACDGVLATTEATFALPELVFGLTPALILPFLAQRLSLQNVRWLALNAAAIHADEAVKLGLADALCTPDGVETMLRSWIKNLRRIDPGVVQTWKRMTAGSPAVGAANGAALTFDRLRDPQVRENLRLFLETGEPPWTRRST